MSIDATTPNDPATEGEPLTIEQQEDVAKSYQFTQADAAEVEPGLGAVGGAGATGGISPDIAKQSKPASINSSDLPSK